MSSHLNSWRAFLEISIPLLLGVVLPMIVMLRLRKKTPIAVNNLRFAPWMMALTWLFVMFTDPPNGWAYRPWRLFELYSMHSLGRNIEVVAMLLVPPIALGVAGFLLHRLFRNKARGEILASISFGLLCLAGLIFAFIPAEWMDWGEQYRSKAFKVDEFVEECVIPAIGFLVAGGIPLIAGASLMFISIVAVPAKPVDQPAEVGPDRLD